MLFQIAILSEKLSTDIALESLDVKMNRVYMPLQAVLIKVLLIASRVMAAVNHCVSMLTLTLSKRLKEWGSISLLLNL